MRIFENCQQLVSEAMRDVWEMGTIEKPKSYQDKNIENVPGFRTKDIINYSYCLLSLDKGYFLFPEGRPVLDWAKAEFAERVDPHFANPGKAWELRPDTWKQFLVEYSGLERMMFHYTYNQRINPVVNIPLIVDELTRNPDSRQAIIAIWKNDDLRLLGGKGRVPCSISYKFRIKDGALHIIYDQRSCDVYTHFGNDIYLAWQMKEFIAHILRIPGGNLYHNITSLHCYEKDWEALQQCSTGYNPRYDETIPAEDLIIDFSDMEIDLFF